MYTQLPLACAKFSNNLTTGRPEKVNQANFRDYLNVGPTSREPDLIAGDNAFSYAIRLVTYNRQALVHTIPRGYNKKGVIRSKHRAK